MHVLNVNDIVRAWLTRLLRTGGPDLSASAAYPKGYGKHLCKMHELVMDRMVYVCMRVCGTSIGSMHVHARMQESDGMKLQAMVIMWIQPSWQTNKLVACARPW